MKTALLLRHDGTQEPITPKNGKHFTLKELQKYVGGYIEILHMRSSHTPQNEEFLNTILVINEEGKLNNLPPNARASHDYWFKAYPMQGLMADYIVGDVVVCHTDMVK